MTSGSNSAAVALEAVDGVVRAATSRLAEMGGPDANQVVAYELAHVASTATIARSMLTYADMGEVESRLAWAFVADLIGELVPKLYGRESLWGVAPEVLDHTRPFVAAHRDPEFLASLADTPGPRHLPADFELVQDTFRRFAENEIEPVAERIHRENADIPEEVIQGLAELGGFGLSVPIEYGGFSEGGESEYLGMVVATEELSRASLAAGGSLMTRPEILARGLLAGGTQEQKRYWLPRLASGEIMSAVAVTEPDHGSDVAGVTVTARRVDGGWLINGVKTWCTFGARADVLMVLARTDPDRGLSHRGLTLFVVPKPRGDGHGFAFIQEPEVGGGASGGGRMEGRAIDTIGYRGMHSFEIAFDDWFVPEDHQVGGLDGVGKGFYAQMAAFENGRLQTAARAVGVMQAAYETARQYSLDRVVFGQAIHSYQLTRAKLGRMVVVIQAARQAAYDVARLVARGEGQLEASMVKAYVCKAAEWVTREAMQIHGGMGYAEEYRVSRYYVDARVLSIFEGADETLCLKVIARRLVERLTDASGSAPLPLLQSTTPTDPRA